MLNDRRNDILKLIAMITMLIDHIGYRFFPYNINEYYIIFRVIGRIAFPIFAYYLAIGFSKTSNLKKYMFRMFIFALITQIPFNFFSPGRLNILFTFLLSLGMLYFYKNKNFVWLIFIILAELLNVDYGAYGLIMVLMFYISQDKKKQTYLYISGVTALYCILNLVGVSKFHFVYIIQIFSLLALPIIFYNFKHSVKFNKYISYTFYPAHILLIVLVEYYLGM